jgi:hypothetical protein
LQANPPFHPLCFIIDTMSAINRLIGIAVCCLGSIGILAYKVLILTATDNALEQFINLTALIFFVVVFVGCLTSDLPLPGKPQKIFGSPEYDMEALVGPSLEGFLLRIASYLVCHRLIGHLIRKPLINLNGPDEMRDLAEQAGRENYPIVFYPICRTFQKVTNAMAKTATDAVQKGNISSSYDNQRIVGVLDYYNAYKADKVTPSQMMFRVFEAMDELKILHMFGDGIFVEFDRTSVMEQARESDKRWQAKQPLSVFDGVPVAIKGMSRSTFLLYCLVYYYWNYASPTCDYTVVSSILILTKF